MKIRVWNRYYEGTPVQIVYQLASRDHGTGLPLSYVHAVAERVKDLTGYEIETGQGFRAFLESLDSVGLIEIMDNGSK